MNTFVISTLHVTDLCARWVVRYRGVLPIQVEPLVRRLEALGWDRELTINVEATA